MSISINTDWEQILVDGFIFRDKKGMEMMGNVQGRAIRWNQTVSCALVSRTSALSGGTYRISRNWQAVLVKCAWCRTIGSEAVVASNSTRILQSQIGDIDRRTSSNPSNLWDYHFLGPWICCYESTKLENVPWACLARSKCLAMPDVIVQD